jgi:hypothetical protein
MYLGVLIDKIDQQEDKGERRENDTHDAQQHESSLQTSSKFSTEQRKKKIHHEFN